MKPLSEIVAELEARITEAKADGNPLPTAHFVDEADLSRLCEAVRCAERFTSRFEHISGGDFIGDMARLLNEWDKIAGGSDDL